MKCLLVILGFLSFSLHAQIFIGNYISYYSDKQLSRQLFDSINAYRNSLNQKSIIWEENYYVTAKKHNDYLAENGLWGHRNEGVGTELIVCVTLSNYEIVDSKLYGYIIDSALRRWKHSYLHNDALIAPLLSSTQYTYKSAWGNGKLDALCFKYGAVSVNVCYGLRGDKRMKHITCVLHLGAYTDTTKELSVP
jgi:hypothetical protein